MKKALIFLIGVINMISVYSQNRLVDSNNDFAFKIYKSTKPDSDNFFISPFSLNIALSIVNEGAKTTTRQEIDSLLCIHDIEDRNNLYNELIKTTTNLKDSDYYKCIKWSVNKSGGNALYLANSLWINRDFEIDETYKQTIEEKYYSDIFDFGKNNLSAANQKLNNWVSEKTNNKIKEISGLNPDIMLSIINAVYFKGEWDMPFDKEKTEEMTFHTIKKEKIKIDFMNDQSYYGYFEDDDIQSIFLNYKCKQFSMVVLLPKERYGINKIEDRINSDYISEIERSSNSNKVILSLPKFKIESEIFPIEQITKMGYTEMFSDKADFSGLSSSDSLKIGKIIHKTFIEIDEEKTEAAAVTKVDMVSVGSIGGYVPLPPPPKIFNADHPFVFLIIDNRTNAIIFMGRFVQE